MGKGTSVEQQELLADNFRRALMRMSSRERIVEGSLAVLLIVATVALWLTNPPHAFALWPALGCWLALVVATMVRFETPFGFTVPIQLAFVPLLFAVPLALVPIAVASALTVSRLYSALRGESDMTRVLYSLGNTMFCLGPIAAFAIAGVDPQHAGAPLLLTALACQFAVDFPVSTLRMVTERGASVASQLPEAWVFTVDAALSGIALVVAEEIHTRPLATLALLPLLALLATFARERHGRLESLVELNNAYRGTALVLGDVIEADDDYTGLHSKSVVELTIAVAEQLELTAGQCRNLEFGALLHDVGKIAIPKEIINKPGKLDPEEWTIIKTHTVVGQSMLTRVGGFMRDVGQIVRSHHERWDGSGYPDQLAGEEIPLESRIIACCDAWNAMRTDRAYRKALDYQTAHAELCSNSGTQFDPTVVAALLAIVSADEEAHHARARATLATAEPLALIS